MLVTQNFDKLSRQQLILRIVELETLLIEKRDLMDDYPEHLSPSQKIILGILYASSPRAISSGFFQEAFSRDGDWDATLKAQICYLRKILRRRSIFISSAYSIGYSLDEANKKKLETAIAQRKTERIQHSNRPIAASRLLHPQPINGDQDA